ncbi:LamB/YcsF family protein [Psychromicrobium sp. YIM B11713]|uniref:LamB/YcsF family protein n=1 Tax=Psychromicrobium sp. YIM B11713 TaxID=3145233 RepID=UPI00374F9532
MTELRIDLNSDLGESFGSWSLGDDEALLSLVSSANLACGFHAGDPLTILRTAKTAVENRVAVGAHPGYRDLAGFGRRFLDLSSDELYGDVLYQLSAIDGMLRTVGAALSYVKPHGALYNRIAVDRQQAKAVAAAVRDFRAGLPMLGMPGSVIESVCQELEVPFFREAFVDRGYLADGTLMPRGAAGALLHDVESVAERALQMALEGTVTAEGGSVISLRPDSLCVHGDTPGAVAMASAVREVLSGAGVRIERFA